jgi:hypothetical protein
MRRNCWILAKDVHAQRCRTPHEQIDAGPCAVPIFRPKMCVHPDAGPCALVTSFQAKQKFSSRTGPCAMVISFQVKDECTSRCRTLRSGYQFSDQRWVYTARCRTLRSTNFQVLDVSTPRLLIFADLYQLLKCIVNRCRRNGNTTRQTLLRLF